MSDDAGVNLNVVGLDRLANGIQRGGWVDSPGPLGEGPTYSKAPAPLGVCDLRPYIGVSDKFSVSEGYGKIMTIKKSFAEAIKRIDLAMERSKSAAKSDVEAREDCLISIYRVKSGDTKGLASATAEVLKKLGDIREKLASCLNIEVPFQYSPGTRWSIWVRQNVWRNMEKGADVTARAKGDDTIVIYPDFFVRGGDYWTLIHETAHLIGISGDVYQDDWGAISNTSDAYKNADGYSWYVHDMTQKYNTMFL